MPEPIVAAPAAPAPAPAPSAPVAPVVPAPAPAGDPPAPERPAWLPEKFKTVEDFTKSYAELESKLGAPPAIPITPVAPATSVMPSDDEWAVYETEVVSKGALSEESYKALEAKGFKRGLVDSYVTGLKAQAADYDNAAFTAAGSKDAYSSMVTWAGANLAPAEQKAFNEAVRSGNKDTMQFAIRGLRDRYTVQNPNLLGGGLPGDLGDVYTSRAQQSKDINDPRYRNDAAFRKQVEAKIGRSGYVT